MYGDWSIGDRETVRRLLVSFIKITKTSFIASMGAASQAEVKTLIKAGLEVGALIMIGMIMILMMMVMTEMVMIYERKLHSP
jgi:hypothetical protein